MMDKVKKIWLNGKLVNWDKARVHILTHALHYGSGAFEGIRCYNTLIGPAIFRLDDHIKRLAYSCRCLGLRPSYSSIDIKKAVIKIIKSNKLNECYIRPIVYYGNSKLGVNPSGLSSDIAISAFPMKYNVIKEFGIAAHISDFIRLHPKSIDVRAKVSGYYSNSVLASLAAKKAGADEAIFLDSDGNVAEGAGENIFIVKKEKIYTPIIGTILPGITRDSIIRIAKDSGYKLIEKRISSKELLSADEVFFTGTAVEVCSVVKINGRKIKSGKPGQITLNIKKQYNKIIRGKDNKYKKWLTYV